MQKKIIQYLLINLCNVVYKVIPKMLVNRLKLLLLETIRQHQSVYVPGALITDTVKLDMHKAYDKVAWCFFRRW
jgi:hypothetical protein